MGSNAVDSLVDQVKERLLPLASADALAERLVEHLPRSLVGVHLRPVQDVAVLDEGNGEYRSLGGDPWFEVSLTPRLPEGGWLYVEAALSRHTGSRVARMRFEGAVLPGGGVEWPVATNVRGSVREVIYLPPGTRRILWQPMAAKGFFSQSPMLVHLVGRVESAARRLHRVLTMLPELADAAGPRHQVPAALRSLFALDKSYRRTADIRAADARGDDYDALLLRTRPTASDLQRIRRRPADAAQTPLISLVMHVANPVPALWDRAVTSIRAQLYSHWELCLAVDATATGQWQAMLDGLQLADARIRCVPILVNANGAQALNQALCEVRGAYLLRVGQHDV